MNLAWPCNVNIKFEKKFSPQTGRWWAFWCFWNYQQLNEKSLILTIGARHPRIGEPLVKEETYPIQWREPRIDLAELAKLRWIEGYSRKQLAEKYGKTTVAIQNYFQDLKRGEFRIPGLSEKERKKLLWASQN